MVSILAFVAIDNSLESLTKGVQLRFSATVHFKLLWAHALRFSSRHSVTMDPLVYRKLQHVIYYLAFLCVAPKHATKTHGVGYWQARKSYHNWVKDLAPRGP